MKNILIYLTSFLILFFIVPAVCTITPQKEIEQETILNVDTNNLEQQSIENSDNSTQKNQDEKYQIIKLLHTDTEITEELNIEEYLYGVVSSEMPANFEIEALKAQAVVARTYTIYQIIHNGNKHENADICDDYACCQAWINKEERLSKWSQEEADSNWNKISEAVDSTKGKIIVYNSKPINAFFHANSGGITESSLNIWGGIDYPYLKSVETSGEEGYTQYNSEVVFSYEELLQKIKVKYEDCEIDFSQGNCIEILEYTTSGRIKTIKFGNKDIAGTEARTLLGLKSTNFTITNDGSKVKFTVIGYGHGVGMSQTGADALAKAGSNYETIIKHFYTDVEIIEVKSL